MANLGFDLNAMRSAVELGAIEWQRHVLQRMLERAISRSDVVRTLLEGERIEDYPTDSPLPSALFHGWSGTRPLHVVAAYSSARKTVYVITVYEPDSMHFEDDRKTRRENP
jgi:hypothetical protein